jgi:hypothetical protein
MSASSLAVPYRWRDVNRTPLPLGCSVQQIAVDPQGGAARCWLYHCGLVIGWDTHWLHLCMDHNGTFVVIRSHLVRALNPSRLHLVRSFSPWGSW